MNEDEQLLNQLLQAMPPEAQFSMDRFTRLQARYKYLDIR
jgi:hypothetical protein